MKWLFLAALLVVPCCQQAQDEGSTIAWIADIQHADKPDAGARRYRLSLEHLDACAEHLSEVDSLALIVQCGDLIDGRAGDPSGTRTDLENVLARLEGVGVPLLHAIGNHCLEVPRSELERRLGVGETAWHASSLPGWRILVLDTQQVSVMGVGEEDPRRLEAEAWLAEHPRERHPSAYRWNGAVGSRQLAWLANQLATAEADGVRAIVMGHAPVLPAASTEHHVAWDHAEVRSVLEASPAAFAYVSGHDHAGGYATEGGVHHLTLHGMVEAGPDSNAYAIVRLLPDRIEVDGFGEEPDRVFLPLRD